MKNKLIITLIAVAFAASPSAMAITWDWSFAGTEAGTFVTDGATPVPSTYTLSDFTVTASGLGGVLGSLGGGDYETGANAYSTSQPFTFDWDGSSVTAWHHVGVNTFDWWAFHEVSGSHTYFFAWDTGNINDPTKATYYDDDGNDSQPAYTVTVTPSTSTSVPDAGSTLALLGCATALLGGIRRRIL